MEQQFQPLKTVFDQVNNTSSILIYMFIILMLCDLFPILMHYEIKDMKYLISFSDLFYINISIILLFYLIHILLNKDILINIVIVITVFTIGIYTTTTSDKDFLENFGWSLALSFLVMFLIGFPKNIYENWFKDGEPGIKWFEGFLGVLFIGLLSIKLMTESSFTRVYYDESNKLYFKKDTHIMSMLFEPKLFSPNQLEKSNDFIEFESSKVEYKNLEELGLLENGKLPYYDYNNKYVWYLNNKNYKTFFVIDEKKRENESCKLHTIITDDLGENKYKIIDRYTEDISCKKS